MAAIVPTKPSTSRSLIRRSGSELSALTTIYAAKYPPVIPSKRKWVNVGAGIKLYEGDGEGAPPFEFQSGVRQFVGFLHTTQENAKTGQPASLRLKFETERPVSEEEKKYDDFWKFVIAEFGPDGTMAEALVEYFATLVPAGKRPSGVKLKPISNVAAKIKADLEKESGKPDFTPQPLKKRPGRALGSGEDGPPMYKVGMVDHWLSEPGPPRELGTCPPEVLDAFARYGMEDSAIPTFFRENPNARPARNLAITVADGTATPWEILAASANAGSSMDYFKIEASICVGGISIKYVEGRRILMLSKYPNKEGTHVVSVVETGGTGAPPPKYDDDIYGTSPATTLYDAEDAVLAAALDASETTASRKRPRTTDA